MVLCRTESVWIFKTRKNMWQKLVGKSNLEFIYYHVKALLFHLNTQELIKKTKILTDC